MSEPAGPVGLLLAHAPGLLALSAELSSAFRKVALKQLELMAHSHLELSSKGQRLQSGFLDGLSPSEGFLGTSVTKESLLHPNLHSAGSGNGNHSVLPKGRAQTSAGLGRVLIQSFSDITNDVSSLPVLPSVVS